MTSSKDSTATPKPVLQARGLVKRYGSVTAIDGADFDLLEGEILAVIGDNGAGKSSLIKALSGAVIPDSGEILVNGSPVTFHSPIDARKYGNETEYQHLAYAPQVHEAGRRDAVRRSTSGRRGSQVGGVRAQRRHPR